MKIRTAVLVGLALVGVSGSLRAGTLEASVVRIRAVGIDGAAKWGSAVAVAHDRLATACHVTRQAAKIEILRDGQRLVAASQAGSLVHDLCVLTVDGLDLPPVATRSSQSLTLGESVTALGFDNGADSLATARGIVKALYVYDGAPVIRTSTEFDFGSSGGGLFDESGRLVGILSFKARTGSELHFALPVDWLDKDSAVAAFLKQINGTDPGLAFWEQSAAYRPTFLGAALREARETTQRQ